MKKTIIFIISIFIVIFCIYIIEGLFCKPYTNNYWIEEFQQYFQENDMDKKVQNLKDGLDDISIEYVDKYLENSKYWDKCVNYVKGYSEENLWTNHDKKLSKEFENIKVPELYSKFGFNPYLYKSIYGLKDSPDLIKKINGKDILDIGGWPYDTAYTFHKYFPKSNIYTYEPVGDLFNEINIVLNEMKKEEPNLKLMHPIQKGVGKDNYKTEMSYLNTKSNAQIVKLDDEYKGNNLGLIKMDIEGFETDAIKGAEKIIKKFKPVLIVAIYHTPYDFFEMKDRLKKINPEYKFKIRRNEDIISDGDLILIAY